MNNATITADGATPVTTPDVEVETTGEFEMFARKRLVGEAVAGYPTTFAVEICSPDEIGGVRFIDPVIVDTLPDDAVFLDAQGTEGVDWTYVDGPPKILTFINLPDVEVGGCLTRTFTVIYDSIPATLPQTNEMDATGTPENDTEPVIISDSLDFPVIAPYAEAYSTKSSSSPSSYIGTEARPGETVIYTVGVNNTGYLDINDITVLEDIPPEVELVSWEVNLTTDPGDPVDGFYQINNSGSWLPLSGNPYSSDTTILVSSLGLDPTELVTDLRWDIGDLAVGVDPWSSDIEVVLDDTLIPEDPPATFQNCTQFSGSYEDGGAQPIGDEACNTVRIIDERAIPRISKSHGGSTFLPLDIVDYTITLVNEGVAHLNLDNPMIADLVPAEFTYIPSSAAVVPDSSDCSTTAPNIYTEDNYNGTGQTLIRWTWNEAVQSGTGCSLAPGDEVVVTYQAQVNEDTAPGIYSNVAALVDWTGPAGTNPDDPTNPENILLCSGDDIYIDFDDLDDDGLDTEVSCRGNIGTQIGVFLALESEKFVRGYYDCTNTTDYGPTTDCEPEDFNKLGLTVPGGIVDWQLVITNTSNVSVTNLVVVDILPFVGDTGVIDPQARLSDWRPNLQTNVTGPFAVPLTIYYSTEGNPCRPEVVPSGPAGCDDPNWTTTLPADSTSVQSVKFDFCTYDGGGSPIECLEIPRDYVLAFDWRMAAPNDVPTHSSCLTPPNDLFDPSANPDCPIAWNSFAYTVDQAKDEDGLPGNDPDALSLLPAEPIKVGIRAAPDVDPDYELGDYVWLDVHGQQNDGIQQPEEPGINGIRVELWDSTNSTPIDLDGDGVGDFRITGPDHAGNPGYYLFNEVPTGDYVLRFYFDPAAMTPSPANQGGDDTLDSDGTTLGTDSPYGDYIRTDPFLFGGADDLTRDQGFWVETDYGDAPTYDGTTYFYPVEAASFPPGEEWKAGRHIIVDGLYMGALVDAELDGQPSTDALGDDENPTSPDDEDGVVFEDYLGTTAKPTGVLTAGTDSTLTISMVVPDLPETDQVDQAYLNAWIDFNADGDWDDPGEQIVVDRISSAPGATVPINVPIPSNAQFGTTYARFRFSFESGLTPYGTALSGEVEDYRVQIIPRPVKSVVATSETHTGGNNLAIGEIVRFRLQTAVPEGSMPNFRIRDNLPTGLQFLNDGTALVAFVSSGDPFPQMSSSDGSIGSNPFIAGDESTISGIVPVFPIPSGAISGGAFGNGTDPTFNFSILSNLDNDQNLEYVVVEFNALMLNISSNQSSVGRTNNFDTLYDSSDDGTAYNERSNNTTNTIVEPQLEAIKTLLTPVYDPPVGPGSTIIYQIVIQHTAASNADALDVVFLDPIPSGLTNPVVNNVTANGVTPPAASIIGGVLRVPDTGTFTLPDGADVTIEFSAQIETAVEPGQLVENIGTLDWSSLPGTGTQGNPTGSVTPGDSGDEDGERDGSGGINDYLDEAVERFEIPGEFGDLPDGPYPTLLASNAAVHLIPDGSQVFLGTLLDAEPDGQPTAGADGDDNNPISGPDDEDGVTFLQPFQPGQPAQIEIVASTDGYLNAWVDFDGDGILEQIASDQFLSAGTNTITVNVPDVQLASQIYSRFRFTSYDPQGQLGPDGLALDGEVEDYVQESLSLGNRVWLDDGSGGGLANNGQQDGSEAGIQGVTLELYTASQTPGVDTPLAVTTTDSNGDYLFTGLTPDDYIVYIPPSNFASGQPLEDLISSFGAGIPNDDLDQEDDENGIDDSQPEVNGIVSGPMTLDFGTEPIFEDGDPNSNLTMDFGFIYGASLGDYVWFEL